MVDVSIVTITGGRIKMETYKAYLVEKDGVEVWIPKSQVKGMQTSNEMKNERGQLVDTELIFMEIPDWLAKKGNVKNIV